jgi:predicted double-glycine peptidase
VDVPVGQAVASIAAPSTGGTLAIAPEVAIGPAGGGTLVAVTAPATQNNVASTSTAPSTAAAAVQDAKKVTVISTAIEPVAQAQPQLIALPASHSFGPLEHIVQTYDNCGPASVAEVLAYWGIYKTQGQVQQVLRADGNPAGMVPYGIPQYARSLGLGHVIGTRGTDKLVKALVSQNIPVVVNQWVSSSYHVGHYRPIQGFDDEQSTFVSSDPFLGPGHTISYSEFDTIWQTNSQRFFLLYPMDKAQTVQTALDGVGWDMKAAYATDLAKLLHRKSTGDHANDGGSIYWAGHLNLALAWDYIVLGETGKAQQALDAATSQGANEVVLGWITNALEAGHI